MAEILDAIRALGAALRDATNGEEQPLVAITFSDRGMAAVEAELNKLHFVQKPGYGVASWGDGRGKFAGAILRRKVATTFAKPDEPEIGRK